ncbi:MAG: 1-acyl-sn-glycerol-3-phosphate acyltransferase [Acidimicrobiia bacterium]|nr:1-acyl-sn-glycerol-3-phosphate acyltransferase [Acidimicrobiia bacterium]
MLGPIARRLWRIDASGYEGLPADGPAILCPNHISFLDSAFLMLTLPRNISFVGKAEYMDSWKTKILFPAMGMIPIDRSGGSKSLAALETAAAVLRRGELFGIFPEGTRSRDGVLHRGRTGAARLALDIGCPIFPVGITGTDTIQPPGAKAPVPFRGSCSITIGRPVRPERYLARPERRLALRSMTDEVMFEIRELTGQQYVDHYAGEAPATEERETARPASVTDATEPAVPQGELVGTAS